MNEQLKSYLEATVESSTRGRRVLIIMITASILVFGSFWNSRSTGWATARVNCAQRALVYLSEPSLAERKGDLGVEAERGKECAETYDLSSPQQAAHFKDRLIDAIATNVMAIKVPVFGMTFDVNDLGLLSGLTFVIILTWFRFALWHEHHNLKRVFKYTRDSPLEERRYCYRALSMRQVLTIPPRISNDESGHERNWKWATRLLFLLPLTVQLTVYLHDWLTFGRGMTVSAGNTIGSICASSMLALLSAILTIVALRWHIKTDEEWEKAAEELREQRGA